MRTGKGMERQKFIVWESLNIILYKKMGQWTQIWPKLDIYFNSAINIVLKEIVTELPPVNKHSSYLLLKPD